MTSALDLASFIQHRATESDHMSSGHRPDEHFGTLTFSGDVMLKRLPADVYEKLLQTIKRHAPLDPAIANSVALAMKEWAI